VARLRPVDLDDILDGPSADGATGPCLPFEPQATAVTQAHVSTRVDDCVHLAIEAHCALTTLAACWFWRGEGWGHWGTQRGAGGCHWQKGDRMCINDVVLRWALLGDPREAALLWWNWFGGGGQLGEMPILACLWDWLPLLFF
jgi:hypothetical protein